MAKTTRKSEDVKQEFSNLCFQYGQAVFNERKAKEDAAHYLGEMFAREKEYINLIEKENEIKAQQAKAQADTDEFNKKLSQPGNDAGVTTAS